jgi:hypothetical protein
MANWNQPMCEDCWRRVYTDRRPTRLTQPEPEVCAFCGADTTSGIYVREDPKAVPFPAKERDD